MEIIFEKGDKNHPVGHGFIYFTDIDGSQKISASYIIFFPIDVLIEKYIPPKKGKKHIPGKSYLSKDISHAVPKSKGGPGYTFLEADVIMFVRACVCIFCILTFHIGCSIF